MPEKGSLAKETGPKKDLIQRPCKAPPCGCGGSDGG